MLLSSTYQTSNNALFFYLRNHNAINYRTNNLMMNNFFSASAKHLLLLAIFLFLGFAQVWGQNVIVDHNFDSGADGWASGGSVGGMTWIRTNSSFTGNTTNHWRINPFNDYGSNDGAHLTSSSMNFSGYSGMTLQVDIRYNTESGFDGMNLYYSTNGGTSWSLLGSTSTGTNWYNDAGVDGINDRYTEITSDPNGWAGDNSNWQTASIALPSALNNASNVLFRFYFGSDGSTVDDGVALDNFKITVPCATPTNYTLSATQGGSNCTGTATLGLSGSQTVVTYTLKRGATTVTSLSGTGSALNFGVQNTAGTYTVEATGSGFCTTTMSGSIVINTPQAVDGTLSGSAASICMGQSFTTTPSGGTGTPRYWVQSPAGTGTWNVYSNEPSNATGNAFTFTPSAPGTYRVHARWQTDCGFCWDLPGGNANCTTFPYVDFTVNPTATPGSIQYHSTTQTICAGNTISSNSLVNATNGGGSGILTTFWIVGEETSPGNYGNWKESSLGVYGHGTSTSLNAAAGGGAGTAQSLSNYNPQNDFPSNTKFILIRRAVTDQCGNCVGGCQDQYFFLNLSTGPGQATSPTPANVATGVCYGGTGAVSSLTWNAVAGATGYNIYGGTTNPPGTGDLLSANQAGTSLSVPGLLAANTTYYWRVDAINACGTTTGAVWSFTTAVTPCGYCVPTYSLGCSNTVDVITRVRLGTLDNTSTWGTTCPTRYVDYTSSVAAPILIPGSTYQLLITVGNDADNFTAAWFDWNGDGDFSDAGEYFNGGDPNANGTATINITVPSNAVGGNIRMRVRGGEDSNINLQSHACGASPSGYGEAEDYTIRIITPDYRVEWVSMNYGSANWCVGDQRTVSVTLKNVGAKTWNTDYTTRVGVKWNTNGGNWNDYHVRVNAGNLAPGQIQTYNFTLEAKNAMAGPTYGSDLSDGINNLTFDVVNEGNCWFGSNSNSCGPGNSVYVSPNIEIQPKPIANAGDDVILPCSGSIQLNATSNNTTLFSEDFGNGTPQELTNTTSNWRIFYRVGTHPANRTKWWIHNNTTQYPCVVNGSALLMQDPIISNQCDYAWDDGTMDEVAYNVNPIDGRLYTSINLGFDYKVTGERSGTTVYDYFQVVYSLDNGATWITLNTGNNGAGYSFTNNNGVNNGFFSLATTPASPNITPASGTHNVDLTFLAGQRFLIGFRWHNDGAAGNYNNFFIDNILVTGNANYAWSPTSGVTNPNTATPTITQNNTYTVTVTAGNGCSTSDAVTVNNTTIPVVPNPNNNTPICKGLDVNVNANGLAPGGQYATLNGSGNSINGNTLSGTLNNHTVEFWVKPNKSIILPNQINSGISGSLSPSENNFAIAPDQIGGIGCTVTSAGTGISVGTNGIAVYQHGPCHFPATLVYQTTISDWVHVAVVHLSNVPYLYLNGNLVKQGLSSLYPTFPNTGTGQAYGHFNGDIDNIRVWSTSRTIAQIQSEMFLETPSNNSGLIAHYTYNGNANASVGSNNTNNGATFSNANYFTYSWSGTSAPSPANTNEARTIVGMPVGSNNLSVTASRNICTSNATNTTVIVNDNNQTATSWTAGSPSNNTDWFDPRNWSNCTPGSNSVVTISRDKPAFPIVNNTSSFDINNPKGKAKAKKVTMDTSGSGSLPTLNINSNTELRVNE